METSTTTKTPAGTKDPAALTDFHRTGRATMQGPDSRHLPALLASAANNRTVRGPWPALLLDDGLVRSMTDVVDAAVAAAALEGDDGEKARLLVYRIDRRVRDTAETAGDFKAAWAAGAEHVSKVGRNADAMAAALAATEPHLPVGRLLPFGMTSAIEVIAHRLAARHHREIDESRQVVERLRGSLSDLLSVEDSEHDVVPKHLEHTTGGAFSGAFDFDRLSNLLDSAPHAAALSPEREERIRSTIAALDAHGRLLFDPDWTPVAAADAAARREALDRAVSGLSRAVNLGRLDLANRFDPERHAGLLSEESDIPPTASERALAPPLLVLGDATDPTPAVWIARNQEESIGRALHRGQAGLQAAISDLDALVAAADWLDEPSVISLYEGQHDRLPGYLVTAAAKDARAVPSVLVRDDHHEWADRIDLSFNEAPESDWLQAVIEYRDPDGRTLSQEARFSWVDFALLDPDRSPHFMVLPDELEDDRLVEAGELLAGGGEKERIPFVWADDGDGLCRIACDRYLMEEAAAALRQWKRLRELGGHANSFAERAREEARAEAEADADARVEALRDEHGTEMESAVAGLAEQIVANIAAGLLGSGSVAPVAPATVAAAPSPVEAVAAPTETAPTDAPPEPEEDDEPALSLDEAYIETIRCTSCNECTNLNGQIFAYNEEKQAFIKDAAGGPYRDMVRAAEKCPVRIIHPGKPTNPDEPGLDEWMERAKPFL